jgi:hypothetical protein
MRMVTEEEEEEEEYPQSPSSILVLRACKADSSKPREPRKDTPYHCSTIVATT